MFKTKIVAAVVSITMLCSLVESYAQNFSGPLSDRSKNVHQAGPNDAQNARNNGMDSIIKGKKLDGYPSATIGDALAGYRNFDARDWKVTKLPAGKTYVDFTGLLKNKFFSFLTQDKKISQHGLEIKFVVYEDGGFGVAMISKLDVMTDGMVKRYPVSNTKAILDSIYTNKEINF